ncbi:MAG: amidohydrolase family protein [Dehalococcoidia bacterium]
MIIDIHNHIWTRDYLPESWWKMYSTFFSGYIAGSELSGTPEEIDKGLFAKSFDPDGSDCLRSMDEAGIDKAVITAIDGTCVLGESPKPIEEQNRELAEMSRTHPDRYIFFSSIDPRKEGALGFVERSVEEWGAKGFKLHPNMSGLYPWDEAAYPIYEKLQALGLPLLVHTGQMFDPLDPKFSEPRELDRVLADFPSLTVIAAHLGIASWRDLIELGQRRSNLVTDFSAFQHEAHENYGRFCYLLRRCLDGLGADRVLFGCDGPVWTLWYSRKWWVDLIKALPGQGTEKASFTQEEIDAMLYKNAQRILS